MCTGHAHLFAQVVLSAPPENSQAMMSTPLMPANILDTVAGLPALLGL
jgi:hypothetical protein